METVIHLQLGTRYWLDKSKTCSGVLAATWPAYKFKDILGVCPYLNDPDGLVGFAGEAIDFYVYQKEDEPEESQIRTV